MNRNRILSFLTGQDTSSYTGHFCYGNLLQHTSQYRSYFSQISWENIYKALVGSGTYVKTPKRAIANYCYGSTITACKWPIYIKGGKHYILPRPYPKSKPGSTGFQIMMRDWFREFVRDVENSAIFFLKELHPNTEESKKILKLMLETRKFVPYELRIAGSCFTHMSLIGKLDPKGEIPPHFDEKDVITALVHLGSGVTGGSTLYYSGLTTEKKGETKKGIDFRHGQIQVGCYNTTLHGVERWSGKRGCINFNLKESILNHFKDEGMHYFKQYRRNKYPSSNFYAT